LMWSRDERVPGILVVKVVGIDICFLHQTCDPRFISKPRTIPCVIWIPVHAGMWVLCRENVSASRCITGLHMSQALFSPF
jgi:hypothetical protein